MRILITGGAGFIGGHVTRHFVKLGHEVIVASRSTYATKFRGIEDMMSQVPFLCGDLSEAYFANQCALTLPDAIIHMAAETHVDRAIDDPACFIRSNVMGTTQLLQAVHQASVAGNAKYPTIIVYSTDEVFGSTPVGEQFTEEAPFNPSNAYSASKVGVEAVVNSFVNTHEMPIMIVRPCNTYGPGQHYEKVVPKFVGQMLRGEPVTVYNDGKGARDWLHTSDHARAVEAILEKGSPGESYNLAAGEEHDDLDIARRIQLTLFEAGYIEQTSFDSMIKLTPGRPGHDKRYWMDGTKLRKLGWSPEVPFSTGFQDTIIWNAENRDWWDHDRVLYGRI